MIMPKSVIRQQEGQYGSQLPAPNTAAFIFSSPPVISCSVRFSVPFSRRLMLSVPEIGEQSDDQTDQK